MLITKVGPVVIIPAVDKVSETMGFDTGALPPNFFEDPASIGAQTDDERRAVSTASVSLVQHLRAHIQKEDQILYPLARAHLPEEARAELDRRTEAFEALGGPEEMRRLADRLTARWSKSVPSDATSPRRSL